MSFLTPLFLLAGLAVAIPIILHLINFRKPNKQHFSTLVFFQHLQKSSIKWLKIKKLILLALRVSGILLLALALARPLLSPGYTFLTPDAGNVLYSVLIENGPAMEQIDERGPVMETALSALESIVQGASQGDRFLIYNTHGPLLYPEELSREQALRSLGSLEHLNAGNFIGERLSQLLSRTSSTELDASGLYLIGRGGTQLKRTFEDFESPDGFRSELVPLTYIKTGEQPAPNSAVVSIDTPNQIIAAGRPVNVNVTVRNFGESRAVNHFLSLEVNGEITGQYQVDLEPGEARNYTFETIAPSSGSVKGRAMLEGDSYTFDNTRYFTIDIPESARILLVTRPETRERRTSWLEPVFLAASRSAGQVELQRTTWENIEEHQLENYHAIILEGVQNVPEYIWSDFISFTQNGGGLVFIPGDGSSPERINPFLSRINAGQFTGIIGTPGSFEDIARVDRLVRGHPVLDEMFDIAEDEDVRLELPNIYHYWKYRTSDTAAGQVILRTNLDDPLLVRHSFGNGRVLIASTSPDPSWSAFAVNPIFAPLFYRIGMYAAAGESGGLNEFVLGRSFEWNSTRSFRTAQITLNDVSLIPEITTTRAGTRFSADSYEWEPGWAVITSETDTIRVAVNQNISESDFKTLEIQELDDIFNAHLNVHRVVSLQGTTENEIGSRIGAAGTGREIWNWFIILAICLLVSESIVAKMLKGGRT